MTKNMTRKGLALGAASALLISGFTALPASSAGLADNSFVSLLPTTGTEYTVLDQMYFDLSANAAATIATAGNVKFLVEDTTASTAFDVDVNGTGVNDATAALDVANGAGFVLPTFTGATISDSATAVITFAAGVPNVLAVGDTIELANADVDPTVGTVTAVNGNVVTTDIPTNAQAGESADQVGDIVRISSQTSTTAFTLYTTAAHTYVIGDTVTLANFVDINGTTAGDPLNAAQVITAVTDNSLSFTLAIPASATAVASDNVTAAGDFSRTNSITLGSVALIENGGSIGNISLIGTLPVVQTTAFDSPVAGRKSATDGTYVVDTNVASATNDKVLRIIQTTAASLSVVVTAWVDANDNGAIDSTEYASAPRTVTFKKSSELVSTVGMSPIPGDEKLTASISTTPVLNGQSVLAQNPDAVNAAFTRQGEATVQYASDDVAVSTWSDVTKTFSVSVFMDADLDSAGSSSVDGNTDVSWVQQSAVATYTGSNNGAEPRKIVVTASGLVTVTVATPHFYLVGEKLNVVINVAAEDAKAASADADGVVVTSVPTTTTFTYQLPSTTTAVAGTADDAVAGLNAGTTINIVTWAAGVSVADRVYAGTYSAKAFFEGTANGSTLTVGAVAAATASATIASTGSAVVTGVTGTTDVANDVVVKTGTTSAVFTVTVLNAAGTAVGAGRPVVLTTEAPVDGGAASGSFKINGLSSATVNTNALGQVVFTLTTTTSSNAAQTRVNAVAENLATIGMDVHWDDQAYTLVDYSTTAGVIGANAAIARTITSTGTYTLDLAVADQWFQAAPAASYRIVVTGSGVTEKIHTLNAAGRAPVVVTDAGIAAVGGNFTSSVALQKLTGTTWAATSTHAVTTTIAAAPTVLLGGDGSSTYQPGGSALLADLSDAVTLKALVEIDKRSSTTATPVYGVANASEVLVQGVTRNSTTSAALTNVYVTISGPNNILFSNGQVAARGSLTFLSDGTGEFEVAMYSTSAQEDSVITVTAMGSSTTTKVSFTGAGVGEGTSLVVTMPAAVKPASTFQVKAKLSDAFGNGVNTLAESIKVTYTGAGIVFGTLPNETDANGELTFSVLLGSNDTGSVNVTVQYNQNGDEDFTDAKDLTTVGTTAITASGVVAASSDTIVNVGTFSGKLVVYALNAAGSEVSYKIAGKWVTQVVTSDLLMRYDRVVGATGATIKVDIYVDGVLKLAKSVVTK
jgi:hypothetical protein